ncbi:putative ferric-chelate reductase 1 homolog [Ctenocephalides felis]|uniref:putative ferric-chelate reductase 1 homolog n=1 Tax=Ctenocephalides felis TaxID=7515 RepID=UPI000E6E3624|nr:putative ferric-chelate reductase 1 homolog [Ctenocephalides felis]
MKPLLACLLLFFIIQRALPLPQGAPESVCDSMMPFHGGGISAQNSQAPFQIFLDSTRTENGQPLRLVLGSSQGVPFKGFMIHARRVMPPYDVVGTFTPAGDDTYKLIDCATPGSTATHTSTVKKQDLQLEWTAPDNFLGRVIFRATVAQEYAQFWVGLESEVVDVVPRGQGGQHGGISTTRRPLPTTPRFSRPSESSSALKNDPFYNGCGSQKTCFGQPEGCVTTKDCKLVMACTVRGEKYQFELKATGNPGYAAVALSDDSKMGDDSVMECVHQNGAVKAFMSWTMPRPNLGVTREGVDQSYITLSNGTFIDGTLYCKFNREARSVVRDRTFDLRKNPYHVLIAAGDDAEIDRVHYHTLGKLASANKQHLSDVSGFAAASKLLLRLHGAFMLTAWVGTASVGILLARYFKQTWTGRTFCGKDQWFAWHRFFMVLTWLLTLSAFVMIFIEIGAWSSEQNPHAILGTVTTILCFLQPIGAFFRPHPGTKRRPIFNWLHWLGGNSAHILAIVTIFFAVKLTKAELPEWMDWILVAFVAFHVIMHLVLSISGCISDRQQTKRVNSFPMKDMSSNGRMMGSADRKQDAPYSGFRRCMLALYLIVIVLLVTALVVIIVLAPIEETWEQLTKNMMGRS